MTTKKFFTKEVKIGIAFVIAFALLYWGLNFLKGVNLFTPTNHYTLRYTDIGGLVVSNNVIIKGHKVGQVHTITYDFTSDTPFTVTININDDIRLPQGTTAILADESLMGGKCINITLGNATTHHNPGDTIPSTIDTGLLGTLADIIPTLKTTIAHTDSLINSLNQITTSTQIQTTLDNIQNITTQLKHTTTTLNNMTNNRLPGIIDQLDTTMTNINSISRQLEAIDYSDIIQSIDTTLQNINHFTTRLNDPDGTIGLLLNDPALYREITTTITSANNLLLDLKANPKRYVHFSLFGGKNKEKQPAKDKK